MTLTTRQLAERWAMAPGTLVNWRINGVGPRFFKLRSNVRYALKDIELFEKRRKRKRTQ